MKKFIIAFATVALASCAAPALATPEPGPDHVPCKVITPKTEKELKRAIRDLRREGFRVTVIKGDQKKVVAQGGDPFPFALAQANVVKSGC